jgi:cobalt-zinc-cadmium efflux system outer membrane protein
VPRGDDAWGGFVSVNLPWLSGKRGAEERKLRFTAQAEAMAVESAKQQVYFEVNDAYLRVEAARTSVSLIRGELMPKSTQSVEVSRSSYENNKATFLELLDAERSQRNVELSYYRALAEHESALADLERASGANLEIQP